jgi:hypothetical protein
MVLARESPRRLMRTFKVFFTNRRGRDSATQELQLTHEQHTPGR